MDKDKELLLCPFCGGEASVRVLEYDDDCKVWGVFCESDLESEYSHGHFVDNYSTEAEAIAAWNTCASDFYPYEQRIVGNGSNWGEIMRDAYDDLMASASESCTPDEIADLEAHIAATLGGQSAKITAEQVMTIAGKHQPDYCSDTHVCFDWQAIADELNVTLDSRECTPHGEWESISQTQEVRHVFCECGYELGTDEHDSWPFQSTRLFAMPNFCPECGRKIHKAVKRRDAQ